VGFDISLFRKAMALHFSNRYEFFRAHSVEICSFSHFLVLPWCLSTSDITCVIQTNTSSDDVTLSVTLV
jgi:hypothetical protein